MSQDVTFLTEMVKKEGAFLDEVYAEMSRVIVGQRNLIERVFIGLLAQGHLLIQGVPGLAKTLTIRTLAQVMDASFSRIQFTPDLLPADVVGTMIYNQVTGKFTVKKGPVFANLVLADEVNRAPAKVQSALLEAMQEHQVTIGDATYPLPEPFLVMATQNPIEQEGTYQLPEAQLDRFLLMVKVSYPTKDEEYDVMERMWTGVVPEVRKILTPEKILKAREVIKQVYFDEKLKRYIVDLVFATRFPDQYGAKELASYIRYGASPRATIYLRSAATAHAFLRHRGYVIPEDVKAVAPDVLRHRVILNYEAEAEDLSSDDVVQKLLESVEVP